MSRALVNLEVEVEIDGEQLYGHGMRARTVVFTYVKDLFSIVIDVLLTWPVSY
jgi:hypothetical protein